VIDGIRYVRAVRRHARLVVATALVAVVLTILMLFFLPQRYRATADVVVILPDVQTGSLIATTAQAVSDFEGALRTAAVARAAAEDSGLSASSISDGLRTEWLEGGTVVEVTFIGPDPGSTEAVVFTASKEAIGFLLDARLAPISHRLENAQQAMAAANQALDDFTIEHELLNVDDYLDSQQDRVRELQSDRDQALLDGDEERAQEIQDRITSLLQETAAIRTEFNTVQTTREQAAASLAEARTAHETALGAVEAAEDASTIKVLSAVPVPRTERLPSQLLVVVVIATALTIGLIVLLELLTPRQRASASASDRSDRAPAGPPPGAVERRRAGTSPPVPVRTSPGGATRGAAGGRAPTTAGNGPPSASRAIPAVDPSIQERRPVPPTPTRTAPPADGATRRPAEVREESPVGPRPSRPDRPVMGGVGAAPRTVAPPPQPVRSPAPERPRRGSVEPADRSTTPGGGSAAAPRPAQGNDRTDVTTDPAPTADPGATSPERAGNAHRSSKNKKRKKRNRQPSGPGAAPASPASATTTTPPSSASQGGDRSSGAGEAKPEPVSASPAEDASATASPGDGGTPAAAAPSGGEEGAAPSAERTEEPTAASNDGGTSSDDGSAISDEPDPSRNA
jgi:capsular polysaccharide biosynthesis protein